MFDVDLVEGIRDQSKFLEEISDILCLCFLRRLGHRYQREGRATLWNVRTLCKIDLETKRAFGLKRFIACLVSSSHGV